MKKFFAALCLSVFMLGAAHSEEAYDPQHTILALNMAIVSINRILTTQDRAVLEWEYDNIINRLAFGNIESDTEMIELYQELLDFINGKKLRQEDSRKLRESYERRQKEAYYRSMYNGFAALSLIPTDSMQAITQVSKDERSTTVNVEGGGEGNLMMKKLSGWFKVFYSSQESHTRITQDPFLPLLGWCGNLSLSAVSSMGMSYYGYHAERERIRSEIASEQWQLRRDEIEACNALQTKLFNSSWRLLRQYKLPDEYRLTENSLSKFFKSMESDNPITRLKMLKMIERDMSAYPPYWFYRARAAFDSEDDDESALCFTKFNEVWRPVLRRDCCKAEAAKYRLNMIVHTTEPTKETLDEICALADTIKRYAPEDDWSSNLFCAFVYFGVGDREKALTCLEENLFFGYENEVSGVVLEEMKKNAEGFTFNDINEAIRKYELIRRRTEFVASVKDSELAGVLTKYFDSCDIEAFAGFEHLMKGEFKESKQYFSKLEEYCGGLFIIGTMYAKGLEVVKDYKKASEYYESAARLGHLQSQFELGNLYYDGGPNLERNYMKAYKWYQVIHPVRDSRIRSAKDYGLLVLYNVFYLGGTVHWGFDKDIEGLASTKTEAMMGLGLFNLAKGTREEREQAFQDAWIIRQSIPAYQAHWK